MDPKTILHVFPKFNGDYPLFDDFVLQLDPSRYRSVVCFLRGRTESKTRLERNGITTIYADPFSTKSRGINLRRLRALVETVREEHVDLIHCQRHKATVYGVLASLRTGGTPVISTVHATRRTRSWKRRFANRFVLRGVAKIVGVSGAVEMDVLKSNPWLPPDRVVAVQNGVNYTKVLEAQTLSKSEARSRFIGGHENDYWFGTVGRLAPKKNHARLIAAFAEVVRQEPKSVLLIAGSGPLEEELKETIQIFGLTENVYLLGHRQDIPEFLRSLDSFIFPSVFEGFGLALLEAMSAGLPVIASTLDEFGEIMGDSGCGYRINPVDENDICEKMLKMRTLNSAAHDRMGTSAKERALGTLSDDRMTVEIVALYEEVLSRSASRPADPGMA